MQKNKKINEIKKQIKALLNTNGFLKATINIRDKRSLKNNKKYKTMYLIHIKNGKKTVLYIPRAWEENVRNWVENYKKVQGYLEKISDINLQKIIKRQK